MPGLGFRFAAFGRGAPFGKTVRNEGNVAWVAVTLSTTAPTPDGGTPSRPVTFTSTTEVGPSGPPPMPMLSSVGSPARVSSRREGTSALYGGDVENQPCTSTTKFTEPVKLNSEISPPSPT